MKNWHLITYTGALLGLLLSSSAMAADLYHNFTGYTFSGKPGAEAQFSSFSVLVVEDGKVVAKGDKDLKQDYPEATLHNLYGRTLLPGLIDSHGHIQTLGENLMQVDLRGINNRTATVAKVANYADSHHELEWVIGRGWNQEIWPTREYPNRQDLDDVISDRPVWLTRVDAHAGWANSKALQLAGITADTEDPDGGQIIRDADGEPTGILIDAAMQLVQDIMPAITDEQRAEAVKLAQDHILQLGITHVLDAGVSAKGLENFRQMHAEGTLNLRVNAMISGSDPALTELLAEGVYRSEDDILRIGNVKLYGDGALGSRGARLIEPYTDDEENLGLLITPEEQVAKLFREVHEAGFQISYHAIGDYPNRLALDEFEKITANDDELTDLSAFRHRIEHAQIVQVKDIPRFKTLGIIPSMQPTHATSDMNMAEDRVGNERIAGAYAWRSFLDQGSIIAAGSDFPVELTNPFYGLHAAVTRQDRNNDPVEGWYPDQAMTFAEALRSFTLDAAYAAFMDDSIGTLEEGKWADFIVLDKDPMKLESKDLWRIKVLSTYIAGERVHHSPK
ncbi:amidohydrolase [Aliidiomarina minuta]|uniref:Amidohydrolase n=2 Tax=Aliidiomarina minuta TaxID=880057 RepID=A0A432W4W4_9GAMM|nr:amidohydrolase [Aliidiomarina minuta]